MAGDRISRRAVVPSLAAGALAVNLAPAASAARTRRYSATAGPCSIWPGHNLKFQFFLPPGRPSAPNQFRLLLHTLDGAEIVSHDFEVAPGRGVEAELAVREDGTLEFNGEPVGQVSTQLVVIAIIAILIGLLLPAVQKVRATSTSFVPGRLAGEQNVDYLLPFIEQDNL